MHAGTRDPEIDVRSIRWERVQLVIEAHVASGKGIEQQLPPPARGRWPPEHAADPDASGPRTGSPSTTTSSPGSTGTGCRLVAGRSGLPVTLDDRTRACIDAQCGGCSFLLEHGLFRSSPPMTPRTAPSALVASVDESVQRAADLVGRRPGPGLPDGGWRSARAGSGSCRSSARRG